MAWAAIAGGVIGGGLGLIGASQSAGAAKDAAGAQLQAGRESRDMYTQETDLGQARALLFAMGDQAIPYLQATLPRERFESIFGRPAAGDAEAAKMRSERDQVRAQLDPYVERKRDGTAIPNKFAEGRAIKDGIDINKLKARANQLDNILARGQDLGTTGMIDRDAISGLTQGGGYLGQMSALTGEASARGDKMMGQFNADTARLTQQGNAMGLGLASYGEGEKARVKREARDTNTAMDRAAIAKLNAGGFGKSTIAATALAENARTVGNTLSDQLGSIRDKQFQTGLGIQQANLGLAADRATRGIGLQGQLNDQKYQYAMAPLAAKQSLLTSNAFQPFLGQNTTQYFPGASPSGASGNVWGSFMQGTGGALFGNAMGGGSGFFGNMGGGGNSGGGLGNLSNGVPIQGPVRQG